MMSLNEFNQLSSARAKEELLKCCGSSAWAEKMTSLRPFEDFRSICTSATEIWNSLQKKDWLEAFSHHPQIGGKTKNTWANQEQKGTQNADSETLTRLAQGNLDYQKRFGHIFLICATGKSATEMLDAITTRLKSSPEKEIETAASEQAKITQLRLEKLFHEK